MDWAALAAGAVVVADFDMTGLSVFGPESFPGRWVGFFTPPTPTTSMSGKSVTAGGPAGVFTAGS
jgi:hypothetical protein